MSLYIRIILSVLLVGLISCKTPTTENNSSLRDVGLIDSMAAKSLVLYGDGNLVLLKTCKELSVSPVTRDCASDIPPRSMSANDFIAKLPFDVGSYPRNDESITVVANFLETAKTAAQAGNESAKATVKKLEQIEKNLKIIRSVRLSLTDKQNSLTYFEYQDEFQKLLAPFGVNPTKDASNNGVPVASNSDGGMSPKQCFEILRREINKNWYDQSLWPVCLSGGDLACVIDRFRKNPTYYPEDLPELCGGIYNLVNQPDFDVSDMPRRPEIQPAIQTPNHSRPPVVVNQPQPPSSGGNTRPCLGAKNHCSVNWECCSNSCGMDGLCQVGGGGCVGRKGFCGVDWQCCSKICDDLTGLCH